MNRVRTLPEEIEAAKAYADAYDKGGFGKNFLGVSHAEFIDFIKKSKLAELVSVRFLQERGVAVRCDNILVTCKDETRCGCDMTVVATGQEIDVKVAPQPFHNFLLVREDQFQAHVHDIYIGTRYISDEIIEIHGYSTGAEMRDAEIVDLGHGPCRRMMLNQIRSIERLIEECLPKKETITKPLFAEPIPVYQEPNTLRRFMK